MDLFDTTQVSLAAALRGSSARQQAIAANIANVNTPGYRRVDVPFTDQLRSAMSSDDTKAIEAWSPATQVDASAPQRADGNSVDLDTESAAEAANGLQYETVAQVLKARIDILKSAMGVS
jgi:flagellar basal-body rod protein FlgB